MSVEVSVLPGATVDLTVQGQTGTLQLGGAGPGVGGERLTSPVQPTAGTWRMGDFVWALDGVTDVAGRALLGWRRITDGSSHVPDTDWQTIYADVAPGPGYVLTEAGERITTEGGSRLTQESSTTLEPKRISELPPADGPLDFEFLGNQDEETRRLPLFVLEGLLRDRLGETSGSTQLPKLTSVAGTATAYTAFGSVPPGGLRTYLFTPHIDCDASPSLNVNGTGPKGLRQQGGGQIRRRMLLAGNTYLITDNGTTYNVLGVVGTHQQFGNLSVYSNGGAIIWRVFKADGDTQPVWQQTFDVDGQISILTGPGGSTPPTLRQRIQPNGDIRAYGKLLLDAGIEAYSIRNPPQTYDDIMEWGAATAYVTNERDTDPWAIQAGTNYPFAPAGDFIHRSVRLTTSGSFVNLDHIADNSTVVIDTLEATGSNRIYAGPGKNFRGYADQVLTVAAGGLYRVYKGGVTTLVVAVDAGSVAAGASQVIPAHANVMAWVGQSWAKRAASHAIVGIQEIYRNAGVDYSTWSIDAATGASSVIDGNSSDPANHWWNTVLDAPGPALLAAKAAILADPLGAQLKDMVWMYGGADIGQISDTGKTTFATIVATQLKINAWLRGPSGLNMPGLRMWFCPVPSKKRSNISPDRAWYAVGRAFLEAAAQDPSGLSFRGFDYYSDFRVLDDEHYVFSSMQDQGRRIARLMRSRLGASEPLGPTITSVTEMNGGAFYRVRIQRGETGMDRPAAPVGFAFLPPGTGWVTPTAIMPAAFSWGSDEFGDFLDVVPETPGAGLRLCYPWGCMEEASARSRVIRGTGSRSPLRTYHPTI